MVNTKLEQMNLLDKFLFDEAMEDSKTYEAAEESGSDRIKRIHATVKQIKKSEKAGMRIMQRWEELVYEREEGKEEVNKLGVMMKEAGRADEFMDSLSDKELQEKLFVEFGLKEA